VQTKPGDDECKLNQVMMCHVCKLNQVLTRLEQRGIRAVVFDFDCTITLKHSGGVANVLLMGC
jgi:predicted HAD superfamily phosphohydrolase YqeG